MKKLYFLLTVLIINAGIYAQNACSGIDSVEYGGQVYHTVAIKNQCWLKENINIGTMIKGVESATNNGVIEKACYDDNPGSCIAYGGLYQWDEAMQYKNSSGKVVGICPSGWHIPSQAEFEALRIAVNYDGNALKALGQGIGDGAGTNLSGFSALMAIGNYNGQWYSQHTSCFWSSTEYDSKNAVDLYLALHYSPAYIGNEDKNYGFPVRCLKDNTTSDIKENLESEKPLGYNLGQNYPNPFNPSTLISYQLPVNCFVTLKVFNALGHEISTLVNEYKTAGNYEVIFNGSSLPSGIYYYELSASGFNKSGKMILMK